MSHSLKFPVTWLLHIDISYMFGIAFHSHLTETKGSGSCEIVQGLTLSIWRLLSKVLSAVRAVSAV